MNRKMLTVGLLLSSVALNAQKPQKPNIIYVFADQLRSDVLGYAGDKKAITPNIDKFSQQAVDFCNAVAVTPVSTAYRASLFTGKYTSSTGMVINELNMNPNHRTVAHVLSEGGYDLGYVGKVHLNDQYRRPYNKGPERFGFDGFWAAYSFNHNSYNAFYDTDDENGERVRVDLKGTYSPPVFTGLAMDYIKKQANQDKPFALFLSWNPPHDPWIKSNVDPKCYEKFKDTKFELPPNFKEEVDQYMDRYPGEYFNGKKSWKKNFTEGGGYQEAMRCYYSMVNSIDEQFGKIVSLVDSLGISDNTIIVFTSDHGEMMASQGRMYKLTFYDEAARIPFLVRYPAVKTKGTSDVCLNTPDIAPTLLSLAGLADKTPKEMEGQDLSFAVKGKKGKEPAFAFMQGMGHTHMWQDGFEWRSVRDKRYTYARYLRDNSEVLIDRLKDPYMKENVAGKKEFASTMKKMRSRMQSKMAELSDEFKPCTWYHDNWMYKDFSIKAAAKGTFGPLPPLEPMRKRK